MIFGAKPGDRVRVHYRKAMFCVMPHSGRVGVVCCAGRGPGPRNVGVRLDDGTRTVVPAGNLMRVER